jgi:hypothetical protein
LSQRLRILWHFTSIISRRLSGLAGPPSGLTQDSSAFYTVNPVGPSDASPAALAIRSRIEALGYGDVKDLARDRAGGWHGHVTRNKVEIAMSVDKGGRITAPKPTNGGSAD